MICNTLSAELIFDLVHDLVYYYAMIVNIHEAKTHFSKLINKALSGEEVLIAKNGNLLVKLTPLVNSMEKRAPGLSAGKAVYSDDFLEPLPENVIDEFEK